MQLKVLLLTVTFITLAQLSESGPARCGSSEVPRGNVSFAVVDKGLLDTINFKFPEKRPPDAAVILGRPFLYTVIEKKPLKITFLNSGGGIRSSFSYYILDPVKKEATNITVVFPDQTCARVGDIVIIGPFEEKTQIGFTITSLQNGTNGDPINATFWSYPTDVNQNPDNISHIAYFSYNGTALVGFEDVLGGGDKDFNDVLISIEPAALPKNCSTCPDNFWTVCCGSFLDRDLSKILGLATALGLVVERFLEVFWSFFNCPPPRVDPIRDNQLIIQQTGRRLNVRKRKLAGPRKEEKDAVKFDILTAQIAIHQKLCEDVARHATYLGKYLNYVGQKALFQARVAQEVSFRIIISLLVGVVFGISATALANYLFPLCWCILQVVGIGIFAAILSPFIHQLFELAFRLQRYLK